MIKRLSALIRPFKNTMIIVLVALAMLQTTQLWFVSITNRNFIYTSFMAFVNPAPSGAASGFASPYRYLAGAGDGRFTAYYGKTPGIDNYTASVIAAALKSGEFIGVSAADYNIDRPAYICEFAFAMPADIFARAYGQRANTLTARGVTEFTSIVIEPPAETDENVRVLFVNNGEASEYALTANNKQEPAARFARDIPSAEGRVYYAALTEGSGAGRFVPLWENGLSYTPVAVSNPYINAYGEKLLSHIKPRVEVFFDNPAAVNAAPGADGVYTFSSVNTVVRYYNNDILEYTSFRPINGGGARNPLTDYAAAAAFIEADIYAENETYLAGFAADGERHIFYFDYIVNGLPLILPDDWPSQAENGHALELTVENGAVVRYKKLVYNFHAETETTAYGYVNYGAFLAELPARFNGRVTLGYRADNARLLDLCWFAYGGGETYIKPIDGR